MVARLISLLALVAAFSAARADLDLTPTGGTYTAESIKMKNVTFFDGIQPVTYVPPRGWLCGGGGSSMVMTIPDHEQAQAYIQIAPQVRIPSLDEKGAELFTTKPELLGLPRGAEKVQVTQIDSPLAIDGHPTLEVQMTYFFYGQNCARSLLLLNRKGKEVSFMLDCRAADFADLHKEFIRSLYSIENL